MAKPKEPTGQVSSAFHDRCMKERLRLTHKLARQLRLDMQGLLEDDTHADLTLVIPDDDDINVHRAILKQRAPWFFEDFLESPSAESKTVDYPDVPSLINVIRDIYTNNNLSHSKHLVQKWREKMDPNSNIHTMPHKEGDLLPLAPNGHSDISPHDSEMGHGDWSASPEFGSTPVDEFRFGHSKIEAISSPDEDLEFDVQVAMHAASACHNGEGGEQMQGCCALGDDLLELLESGMDTDVEILIQGQVLRAHKCILCVRSSYFGAMLGGAWRESSGQQVSLEGVSVSVVEQCLRYMYGGVVTLMPGCSLPELVATSDMYAIEGLKDVAEFILRMEHCHFFHKPCNGCLVGVADTLSLASVYGMSDLEKKCLQWSNKYFVRLWPNKSFASLPQNLLDKCCWALTDDLKVENVLEKLMDCDRLVGSLPQVKWAEPLTAMTNQVIETCIAFLSRHLVEVLNLDSFHEIGKTMQLGMSFIDDVFGKAVMSLPADRACATYIACKRLKDCCAEQEDTFQMEDFKKFVDVIFEKCEQYMNLHINQVVGSQGWQDLPPELQKYIKEGAWYVSVSDAKRKPLPPRLQNPGAARKLQTKPPSESKPAKRLSTLPSSSPKKSSTAVRSASDQPTKPKTETAAAKAGPSKTRASLGSSKSSRTATLDSSRPSTSEPKPSTSRSGTKPGQSSQKVVPAAASSVRLKTGSKTNAAARAGAHGIPFVTKAKSSWTAARKSSSASSGTGSSRKSSGGSGPQSTLSSSKVKDAVGVQTQKASTMASEVAVLGTDHISPLTSGDDNIDSDKVRDSNDNVQMSESEKVGPDQALDNDPRAAPAESDSNRSSIEKENANNLRQAKVPRRSMLPPPPKSGSRPSSAKSRIPKSPSKRSPPRSATEEKASGLTRAERIAARQAQIESDREKGLIPPTRWSPKPQDKPTGKSAMSPANRGRAEVERARIAQTEAWAKAQLKQVNSTSAQMNRRDLKDLLDKGAANRMKKRLREDDDLSLCSQRAVRGSVATPFDMTPSDFGSDGPSELFEASDVNSRTNSLGTISLTQPSSSVDDGYSSNKTIDSDFEPPSPRIFPADSFIPYLIFDFLLPDGEKPSRS